VWGKVKAFLARMSGGVVVVDISEALHTYIIYIWEGREINGVGGVG